MFLFLIALVTVVLALGIGAVIEFQHQREKYRKRKLKKNGKVDQQIFETWLANKDKPISNVQSNIKRYSAKNPL